jgi:hypothetical protein
VRNIVRRGRGGSDGRTITALSSACILLAVLAAALALYDPDGAETVPPVPGIFEITSIPVSEIGAAAVSNALVSYGLMNHPSGVEVVSDVYGNWSQQELRAFIGAACRLTGSRKLPDASVAETLGLNDPLARVTLIKTDGTNVKFSVLSRSEISGEYYVFSEEHQAVYMVSAADAEIFLRSESAFLPRTIFPAINAGDLDRLSAVSVDFLTEGRSYAVERAGSSFFITSPITRRVTANAVAETLLRPLSSVRSDDPPEYEPEGAAVSWDLRVAMAADGTEYSALAAARGGRIIMKDEKTGLVISSKADFRPAFYGGFMSMIGSRAVYYPAGDVSYIRAEYREVMFSEYRGGGPEAGGFGPRASGILEALNSLEIAAEAARGHTETGKEPVLRVTIGLMSGETDEISLIPAEGGLYLAAVNGTANFAVSGAAFSRLRDAVSD